MAELFTSHTWLQRTFVFGKRRSVQLRALDQAISVYASSPTATNKNSVRNALAAWKNKETNEGTKWQLSSRNRDSAIFDLDKRLDAGLLFDPSSPLGKEAISYEEEKIASRVMMLKYFAAMDVEGETFDIIVDTGLDLTDSAFGFASASGAIGDGITDVLGKVTQGARILKDDVAPRAEEMYRKKMNGEARKINVYRIKRAAAAIPAKLQQAIRDIKEKLLKYANEIIDNLKTTFSLDRDIGFLKRAESFLSAIDDLIDRLVSHFVPFIKDAKDIAKETVKACSKAVDLWKSHFTLGAVEFNNGHPAVIVDSIELCLKRLIAQNVYKVGKGAGGIGIAVAGLGVGGIIYDFTIACCEIIAKAAYRLYEISHLKAFFKECKDRHSRYVAALENGNTQEKDTVHNGITFETWFRAAAYTCPVVSSLALGSGICGDATVYIGCLSGKGNDGLVDASVFQQGIEKLALLKKTANKYLVDSGYKFTSDSQEVRGAIRRAGGATADESEILKAFTRENQLGQALGGAHEAKYVAVTPWSDFKGGMANLRPTPRK